MFPGFVVGKFEAVGKKLKNAFHGVSGFAKIQ